MSNQSHHLAWINENETGLAAWIRRYLTKRGKSLPRSLLKPNELGGIKREIERWPTTGPEGDTTWKLLRQMNEAWTQQKIRDKRKKNKQKACSFVLSSAAQKNLQQLTNAHGHGTAADCLEWLLQNSGVQFKAADKERKETKERHNEELRGKQSHIDALGHLLGHTLWELAISTTELIEAKKTCQTLCGAQEGEIEKTYGVARKNAIERISGLTHLSPKHIAGLIQRPSSEKITTSEPNTLPAKLGQPSTSNIEPPNSLEQEHLKAENYKVGGISTACPEEPLILVGPTEQFPNMTNPDDAVELPGEPEHFEQSHTQLEFSIEGVKLPKRGKLSTDTQKSLSKLFLPPKQQDLVPLEPDDASD